jgi:hypothetical protein
MEICSEYNMLILLMRIIKVSKLMAAPGSRGAYPEK